MSPFSSSPLDPYDDARTQTLAILRKESLDIYNRLHSIAEDAEFVETVAKEYSDLPTLPNLRCGAWYVDPHIASTHAAYFKSTDGHYNNWSFNLRRPNIHLLSVLERHGGLVLVDSTRAGKRLPDALSKTVPIWCAVVNRAIQKVHRKVMGWDEALYTPPGVVSAQEHKHIVEELDEWAEGLAHSSYELPDLTRPLRPMWITPATRTFPTLGPLEQREFVPVICVSASRQIEEGIERRTKGYAYVQGSGDDHELWGLGLSPDMFWSEKARLLSSSRADLPDLVANVIAEYLTTQQDTWKSLPTGITKINGRLLISSLGDTPRSLPTVLPNCDSSLAYVIIAEAQTLAHFRPPYESYTQIPPGTIVKSGAGIPVGDLFGHEQHSSLRNNTLLLEMPKGKKGQTQFLHAVLPQSLSFIRQQLEEGRNVCVCCHNGKDASVGVVLTALQTLFDDDGRYFRSSSTVADKKSLATRLQWIISDRPEANPSRVTLKRINEFLLTDPQLRR